MRAMFRFRWIGCLGLTTLPLVLLLVGWSGTSYGIFLFLGALGLTPFLILRTGAALANGTCALGEWLDRSLRRVRFVCPHCLCRAPIRYVCGHCRTAVEPAVVRTQGFLADRCARCAARLFGDRQEPGVGFFAFCATCRTTSAAGRNRLRPRVIGCLPQEREAVLAEVADLPESTRCSRHAEVLQDEELTLVLPLDARGYPDGPSSSEALQEMRELWLSGEGVDLLELGRLLDLLAREIAPLRLPQVRVVVGTAEPEPALRRFLEARFRRVDCGIALKSLIEYGEDALPRWCVEPADCRNPGPQTLKSSVEGS